MTPPAPIRPQRDAKRPPACRRGPLAQTDCRPTADRLQTDRLQMTFRGLPPGYWPHPDWMPWAICRLGTPPLQIRLFSRSQLKDPWLWA